MINDPVLSHEWLAVCPSQYVPEGGVRAARLLGVDLVLWRTEGRIHVWRDLCIHRGAKLSLGRVEGECLVCPYHAWTYNEQGRCVRIPAHPEQTPPLKAQAITFRAEERYDLIWMCFGEPSHEIPPLDEWDDPTYRNMLCGPYEFRNSGPRAIENFLDVAHLAFVHEGILGVPDHAEIADYEVEVGQNGVEATDVRLFQPNGYGTGQGEVVNYTYRVLRPLTVYLAKESEGPRFSLYYTITPVEEKESIGWMWMNMNYAHDTPEEELIAWQDHIASQDIPIVNSQRPELLPLDLQAELHLRSDRIAIGYRKWLKELGLSFGTA